jgi:AraC family transcriptional activator of pobA
MGYATPLAVAFREVRHFQPDDCLHCEAIAVRARAQGWTIPAHRHEGLHQFQWLASGSAELTLDGRSTRLVAPAALMIAPAAVHGFAYALETEGLQVSVPSRVLARGLSDAPALAARLGVSLLFDSSQASDGFDALATAMGNIAQEFRGDAPGRVEALQSLALLLALWFLRRADGRQAEDHRAGARDTLVQRLRALVETHFREQRPVSFYADRLGVTPDHLSRACRAVSGLSALDLLHERVLLEARRMLVYTERPVTEIATQLGFEDPHYFSRFFSRRAGVAPTLYRVRVAEGMSLAPGIDRQ